MIIELLLLWVGLAAIAVMVYSIIERWINTHRTRRASYAKVIKERLASGKFRIVTNIISTAGTTEATKTWDAEELDDDLKARFGYSDSFVVGL